jgi:hypothetical protein
MSTDHNAELTSVDKPGQTAPHTGFDRFETSGKSLCPDLIDSNISLDDPKVPHLGL